MKTSILIRKFTWTLLFAGFFLLNNVAGQEITYPDDNPLLDQIPRSLLEEFPDHSPPPLSSVITKDNWDNFSLGVDFAESNMTAHPGMPAWYFTAYNTNGTHHTENGHNWGINNPSFGAVMRGDPVVAYDSLGNLFYENMYGSPNILGCKVAVSSTNGQSWDTITSAITGVDKNWIAADQTAGPYANYVYTTMTGNFGGNFARSTDHGSTWQTTFTPSTQGLPGMMPCVGAYQNIQGGAVYVVTNGGSTFAATYTFYRSFDGGSTFQMMSGQQFAGYVGTNVNDRHSVQNMRTRPYPFITADNSYGPNRGRLYCVYATNDPPGNGNKPDVWCRYSDNGGTTWSGAARVNDDANPTQNHQWHPATWCDKETGRLYIQWMDTRDVPTSDSAYIYATYSDDGGVTFAANQQISNAPMKINCTSCVGGGTPRYQGDYNGIVSNKKVAMAGWTDFRNGTFLSVTGYFPDYALTLDHSTDTVYTPADTAVFYVCIPEVKLYTDTVLVSAEIDPVPTAGNIVISLPMGTEITTYPDSLPVQVVLTGNVPPGPYHVDVTTQGPNGTPVHKRTATLRVLTGGGFMVNATATPDSICQGTTSQLNATVYGGTAPFTYQWTPAGSLNDPTIANPLAQPDVTTKYFVTVTDGATLTVNDSVTVTVMTAPPSPGTIYGAAQVCSDSVSEYYVEPMTGVQSYSWTVPADAVILSGQNTPVITVQWGDTSGVMSVIAGNECGNSSPAVLAVTVKSAPPDPGPVYGPETGCQGLETVFYVNEIPGDPEYIWTVPADATITAGQGTREVTVIWGPSPGNIRVVARNQCGESLPGERTIQSDTVPAPAGTITGIDTVCVNHTGYPYSVPVIMHAGTYVWTLPAGAIIGSGQGTNEVTVDFGPDAESGAISVYGENVCGPGNSATFPVYVSGCEGIQENTLNIRVAVYPNPADRGITVSITGKDQDLRLSLVDINGQTVCQEMISITGNQFSRIISLDRLPSGIYALKLENGNGYFTEKIIISH